VSGQTPRDPKTGDLVGTNVQGQTRQTLDNVKALLAQAGAHLTDVISVTVYLQNVDDWGDMNTVYTEYFTQPYPTRTAIGAELRDILVEISVVAHIAA
jgi:2-iminobutanoate/2-iminopropanoate deaminase